MLDSLVEAACLAPAPHHSRPWRFVVIDTDDAKAASRADGQQWAESTSLRDGVAPDRVAQLVQDSHTKITAAPALVLACLTWDGLVLYPDEHRRRPRCGAWHGCRRSAPRSRTSC